jgi:hypothetical protein
MGQITTITLNDAESTPVAHVFLPRKVVGDVAHFVEKSDSRPMGFKPLVMSHRSPDSGNGSSVVRDRITLSIPVVETVDGVDTVVRTAVFDCEFRTSVAATEQERDNLITMSVDLLTDTLTRDMVVSGNNIY